MKGVVAFATLFLGLTIGPKPVELVVGHEVATVEVRLDGELVARLDGAPWRALCDLGRRLEPRQLEAVAYAADGDELGRAEQWLNVPRSPARAELLLDRDPERGRVVARVRWSSLTSLMPERVVVSFDGRPIEAEDPSTIVLPPHDPEQLHYLKVELEFPRGLTSTVERTFGGSFVDDVASELTAVPLQLERGAEAPEPRTGGWIRARGEPLSVVDVVTGPAQIILVRDQSAQPELDRMVRRSFGDFGAVGTLKRGYSLQILRPVAERVEGAMNDVRLFRPSPVLTRRDGGVFWLLTAIRAPKVPPRAQRLSDAVAVAGASVAATGQRRAVVLLVGPHPHDFSQHGPSAARHYLESMRVPLVVWSTEGKERTPWGPAEDASSMHRIERQTKRLVKELERQRIAWVRGVYQPPEISLTAGDPGVRLAGT